MTNTAPTRVRVDLGARAYDILIGPGLVAGAGPLVRGVTTGKRALVVTDAAVEALHLAPLRAALDAVGLETKAIVVPSGEGSKSLDRYAEVTETALGWGVERSTPVIALGGGVVGDLAGFLAASCLRGLPFIQVPTTLLAQVDSAVGGKTGINSAHGKNLIGAFHQPVLVVSDTGTLDTLPARELRAGYAEVVKYGAIDDPAFFTWLEANGAAVLVGDAGARAEAIRVSCEAKARIVAADEREAGMRALLNLGHTFGHALEAEAGYGDALLHGEAVAIGMVMAHRLSVALGLCPEEDAERLEAHLTATGLPTRPPRQLDWDVERLIGHMGRDKKVQDSRVTFILSRGLGRAFVARDVDLDAVRAVLHQALAA